MSQHLKSPDDELEALQKLLTLSPPKALKQYFIRYHELNDSIQTTRNAAKNQFALIRYEEEKNKADNLTLQKDNTEKKIQIIRQRTFLYGTIFIFLLGTVIAIVWYGRRKQQIMWESRNAIRENQLKTSRRVHDVVANGLYRIMAGLEHQNTIEKELLLDKIEVLYEQSRDISYEVPENLRQDFQEAIAELLMSFASPLTKILIVGNHQDLWNDVKAHSKIEVEHILQELMINMKKHSYAKNVVIRFERQDDQFKIQYTDDGIGLPSLFHYGNGLTNTENRIKSIDGRIIFDNTTPKGLKIQVHFPIA
jgi:signal transduction histidine kinase